KTAYEMPKGLEFRRVLFRSFVSAAGLLASVLVVVSVAQPRGSFTVGTATAARGHKATGTIEVPPGVDAGLSIPVAVFQGAKPGQIGRAACRERAGGAVVAQA